MAKFHHPAVACSGQSCIFCGSIPPSGRWWCEAPEGPFLRQHIKNRTPAGAVCGYALFPFSGFAVEVGDIDQLHLADVVVAAQGIDQHAGGVH